MKLVRKPTISVESGNPKPIKLRAYVKQSGIKHMLRKDSIVSNVIRQSESSFVTVDYDETHSGRRRVSMRIDGTSEIGTSDRLLITRKGIKIRANAPNSSFNLRIDELPSGPGRDARTLAVVSGKIEIELADSGFIEIGQIERSPSGRSSIRPSSALALGQESGFKFRDSINLVIDEEENTVRTSNPVSLLGRVYRLGQTGLLMTFNSFVFCSSSDRTKYSFRGGKLVGVA